MTYSPPFQIGLADAASSDFGPPSYQGERVAPNGALSQVALFWMVFRNGGRQLVTPKSPATKRMGSDEGFAQELKLGVSGEQANDNTRTNGSRPEAGAAHAARE